jgi:hypothetical protein
MGSNRVFIVRGRAFIYGILQKANALEFAFGELHDLMIPSLG